jgi:peptidyl-prolyl cis-trans isomerase A (cyclophilin A)
MCCKRLFIFLFMLAMFALPWKAAAQIYADVAVGGAVSGTFTISLEYQKTPATVANFIGLATGKKGWLDYSTGNLRYDPFYNGVTFHRVIAGFMSQTGSRAGDGSDGPGYTFRNEIDATLSHSALYTVAMANSGRDTNGSQWYITARNLSAANIAGMDGNYTIFGHITSGTSVCDAINSVATTGAGGSPANHPLTAVTINSISIYGPSYASFNLTPNALPKVLSANPVMKVSGSSAALGYDHKSYSYYIGYHSVDLVNWSKWANSYFHSTAPAAGDADVTSLATGSKHFFRLARVDYSLASPWVPGSLAGKTLVFSSLTNPFGGTLVVNAAGTSGTWAFNGYSASALASYTYYPSPNNPYWSYLYLKTSDGYQFAFDKLYYTSGTTGTYVGRTSVSGYSNVSGTFTSSP